MPRNDAWNARSAGEVVAVLIGLPFALLLEALFLVGALVSWRSERANRASLRARAFAPRDARMGHPSTP